jgi:hypothetical protein
LKDHYHLYANIIVTDNNQVNNYPLNNWIKYKIEFEEENVKFKYNDKKHVNFEIPYENLIFKYDRLVWNIDDIMNYENGTGFNFFSKIKRMLVKIKLTAGVSSIFLIPYYNSSNEIKYIIISEYDSSDQAISSLKVILENMLDNYVDCLKKKKLIWKGQQFNENEKLNLFHWSENKETSRTDILNPHRFFTAFTDEGILISEQDRMKNKNLLNYSFRFDQVINCDGYLKSKSLKKLKKSIPAKLINEIQNFDCCVGYNTDWEESPNKELFCSNIKDLKYCKTEILLFANSLFYKCINFSVIEFFLSIAGDEYKFDKFVENLPHTQKIRFYYLLLNLKKYDIIENRNDIRFQKIKVFLELFVNNYEIYFEKFKYSLRNVNVEEILLGTFSIENNHPEIDRSDLISKLNKNFLSQGYNKKLYEQIVNEMVKVDDLAVLLSKIMDKRIKLPLNLIKDFSYLNIKLIKNNLTILFNQEDLNFIMKNEKGKGKMFKKSQIKIELPNANKNSNTNSNQTNNIKNEKNISKFNYKTAQSQNDKSRVIKEIHEYLKNINEKDEKYLLKVILELKNKKFKIKKNIDKKSQQKITEFKILGKGNKVVGQIVKQIMQNKKIADENKNKKQQDQSKTKDRNGISPTEKINKTSEKHDENKEYIYNLEDEDDKQFGLLINKSNNENKKQSNLKSIKDNQISNVKNNQEPQKKKKSNFSVRIDDTQKTGDKSNVKILNKYDEILNNKTVYKIRPLISNQIKLKQENLFQTQDGDFIYSFDDDEIKRVKDSLENTKKKIQIPIRKSNLNQTVEGEIYYNIDDDEEKQITEILNEIDNTRNTNKKAISSRKTIKSKESNKNNKPRTKNILINDDYIIDDSSNSMNNEIRKLDNSKNLNKRIEIKDLTIENTTESPLKSQKVEKENELHSTNANFNYNNSNEKDENKMYSSEANKSNKISNGFNNVESEISQQDDFNPSYNISNNSINTSLSNSSNIDKGDCITKEQMKRLLFQNQQESYEKTNSHNLLNRIKVFNHIVDPIPIEQIHVVNALPHPQLVKIHSGNMLVQTLESPFQLSKLDIINHNELNYGI